MAPCDLPGFLQTQKFHGHVKHTFLAHGFLLVLATNLRIWRAINSSFVEPLSCSLRILQRGQAGIVREVAKGIPCPPSFIGHEPFERLACGARRAGVAG